MDKDTLQKRIEKKEQDILKIEKRINKWSSGLRPEDIDICKPFGDCIYGTAPRSMNWRDYHGTPEYQEAKRNYNDYLEIHKNDIPKSDEWSKGPNIGELYSAYRDLGEARYTLEKYKAELTNLDKFNKEEKIEILWKFLQEWKKEASDYYHENASLLGKLNNSYAKDWDNYKNSVEYEDLFNYYTSHNYRDYNARWAIEKKFNEKYYEDVDSFTREISDRHGNVDETKLENSLNKEVKRKYERLVREVTEKAGEILDASNLSISQTGEISGTIQGTKNKVNLWATFVRGDIQRPHFRSYCHIAK